MPRSRLSASGPDGIRAKREKMPTKPGIVLPGRALYEVEAAQPPLFGRTRFYHEQPHYSYQIGAVALKPPPLLNLTGRRLES